MLTYEQAAAFILYTIVFVSVALFVVGYGFYRLGYSDGERDGSRIRRRVERKVRRGEIIEIKQLS